MADPTTYTVSFSFAGFQSLNPATPLPADSLDVELAGIETSVDSIIAALADIRRSDGNAQNGIVTYDALSDDVKELIAGSEIGINIGQISAAAFATQTEAEAGAANDKIMTPLRTKQQVDAVRPLVDQATAEAGTDNTEVMTPLRTVQLLDAVRPITDQATAEAGTNNTEAMTPLRTTQQIDAVRTAFTATTDLTWGAISAGASSEQSVTVTGAAANDRVVIGLENGALDAGLIAQAWVVSADTVRIRLTNITGSPITPNSGSAASYALTALRF